MEVDSQTPARFGGVELNQHPIAIGESVTATVYQDFATAKQSFKTIVSIDWEMAAAAVYPLPSRKLRLG